MLERRKTRRLWRMIFLVVLLMLLIAYYAWLEPWGTLPKLWTAAHARFHR
jgi:hypothetical protein